MTVKELIEELQKHDPDATITVRACCGTEGHPVDVELAHEKWVKIICD